MSELPAWIIEQLKRGYSREQIKQSLIKKGYPASALSGVDSVRAPLPLQTTSTKFMRPHSQVIILAVVIIVTVILFLIIFMSNLQPKETDANQKASASGLVPVGQLAEGRPVTRHLGVVTKISATYITFLTNNITRDFPISAARPPQYVLDEGGEFIILENPPTEESIPAKLFVSKLASREPYVVRVIFNRQEKTNQ